MLADVNRSSAGDRQVEAGDVARREAQAARLEHAIAFEVPAAELDLGPEAAPLLEQRAPVRRHLDAVVALVVELPQAALRLVGEHEGLARRVELVERLAQVGLGAVGEREGRLPLEPAVRRAGEQVVAADVVGANLLVDEVEPAVAEVGVSVAVVALEPARLVRAEMRVEVVERQPVVRRELVRHVAHRAQGALVGGDVEVVRAVEDVDRPALLHVEEGLPLVDERRRLGVTERRDDPQVAEPAAEQAGVALVRRMVLVDRIPHVVERAAEPLDLALQEADLVVGEPPAADDLAVRDDARQRPRTVVEPGPFAPAARIGEPARAGRDAVPAAAGADLPGRLHGQLERDDLDQAARELRGLVRRVGLAHLDAVDQRGRKEVERHDPPVGLGRRQHGAVQRGVAVALAQAADEDRSAADHRDAGDALHRIGGVRVVVGAHLDGADVVLHDRRPHPQHELRGRRGRFRLEVGRRHRDLLGEDVRRQRHLHARQLAALHVERHHLLGVAGKRHLEIVRTGRDPEAVVAVQIRVLDLVDRAGQLDRNAGQRDRVRLVYDLARDGAKLLTLRGRRHEQHRQGPSPHRPPHLCSFPSGHLG